MKCEVCFGLCTLELCSLEDPFFLWNVHSGVVLRSEVKFAVCRVCSTICTCRRTLCQLYLSQWRRTRLVLELVATERTYGLDLFSSPPSVCVWWFVYMRVCGGVDGHTIRSLTDSSTNTHLRYVLNMRHALRAYVIPRAVGTKGSRLC